MNARAPSHAELAARFDLRGIVPKRGRTADSQVLLELTPISKSEDVHEVVGRIQQKAQQINLHSTIGCAGSEEGQRIRQEDQHDDDDDKWANKR